MAPRIRRRLALKALSSVGDPTAQWEEDRPLAFHVRRRLTQAEQAITGPVRDLRGTAEGRERWEAQRAVLPLAVYDMAMEELHKHAD